MADLTLAQAQEMFDTLLPDDVTVYYVDHEQYIKESLHHPFIQTQIKIGIYTEQDLGTEFLSVARTFADERVIEVDFDLLVEHMKGVSLDEAFGYCASIVLHEYHHIEYHRGPAHTEAEQVQREVECNTYLNTKYPDVMAQAGRAEQQSNTIQRVYARIAALTPRP